MHNTRLFPISAVIVIILTTLFAGCTSEKETETGVIIQEARTALQTIRTSNAEMTMNFKYSFQQEGQPDSEITGSTLSQRIFLENPVRIKASAALIINGAMKEKSAYYGIQQENSMRYYMPKNNEWVYFDAPLSEDHTPRTDATSNLAFVLTYATDFALVADEQPEGETMYRFRARLSGDALYTFISGTGLPGYLIHADEPAISLESFDLAATIAEFGSQEIDIRILKDTHMPVGYTADLSVLATRLLENALQRVPETAAVSCRIDTFTLSVIYRNINNAEDFELPAEVQNAREATSDES